MARRTVSLSPDRCWQLEVDEWEARASCWVATPRVIDARNGATCLKFSDPNWSLEASLWTDGPKLQLQLRRFPGNHRPDSLDVEFDPNTRQTRVGDFSVPNDALEATLSSLLRTITSTP
jgi:hypothetical protein